MSARNRCPHCLAPLVYVESAVHGRVALHHSPACDGFANAARGKGLELGFTTFFVGFVKRGPPTPTSTRSSKQ